MLDTTSSKLATLSRGAGLPGAHDHEVVGLPFCVLGHAGSPRFFQKRRRSERIASRDAIPTLGRGQRTEMILLGRYSSGPAEHLVANPEN